MNKSTRNALLIIIVLGCILLFAAAADSGFSLNASVLTRAPLTWLMIAANVIVFLLESLQGGSTNISTAIRFGAVSFDLAVRKGQWWRLFTSMFVHFGIWHLFCNMYALYCLGPSVEVLFGEGHFVLIYLLSGLAGNLLYLAPIKAGRRRDGVSAGASGAIFGLMGAFLVLVLFPQTRGLVNLRSLYYSIAVNLLIGLLDRRINMLAHIGGLLGGFVTTLVLVLFF